MEEISLERRAGARLHQVGVGVIPVAGYLFGWPAAAWVALGLSAAAMVSIRLSPLAYLVRLFGSRRWDSSSEWVHEGIRRADEGIRIALLGAGLALLEKGQWPLGWLTILAASAIAILAGTTGFSFAMVLYGILKAGWDHLWPGPSARSAGGAAEGNPRCVIVRSLGGAPYRRCLWCTVSSVRSCCGVQTWMLLGLMLAMALLLGSALNPLAMKTLVTMSLVGVVALGLAMSRQTEDLVGTLDNLAEEHRRTEKRCEFLKRLSAAESPKAAAEETVTYIESNTKSRRISVMVAEGGVLRILASRGIPEATAGEVAVPIGERICGRVFASGRPLVLRNILSERPHEALGLNGDGAAAAYPLIAAGMRVGTRKIGVINATDRAGGEFSEDDLRELAFTAEAAAISLMSQLSSRDLERANYAALVTLALALEAKDPYTNGHSQRVRQWAVALGRQLGLSGSRLEMLSCAAELHDIGKLAIPDSILEANRELTAAEWVIVREHPRRGVEMTKHLTFLRDAQPAILYHHERVDGHGYPEGLQGPKIPLEAKILAVIDAYDAMTSVRPYRPALAHEAAVAELHRCTGTQFAPEVVGALVRMLDGAVAEAVGAMTSAVDR